MVIVRTGVTGTVAVAAPFALSAVAEKIADALMAAYPQATVRVVVNHCLAPEIIRVDRVDPAQALAVVHALRGLDPKAASQADTRGAINARCAALLRVDDVSAFSLRALSDMVKPIDAKLAAQIDRMISTDTGAQVDCAFCSLPVAPKDYVDARLPGAGTGAHHACLTAREAADPPRMLARLALETQPAVWRALLSLWSDAEVRAVTAEALSALAL